MKTIFILFFVFYSFIGMAQKEQKIKLNNLLKKEKLSIINREAKAIDSLKYSYIRVSESKGEEIIWLPTKAFKNGTIEIEMRGKDVFQRSFIGITFHGKNDTTFDAVYCRPFNFFAKDPVRKIHAIQYISHPIFTWKKLRDEKNGLYEKEVINPPNPNDWFRMTVVIDGKTVKAFINNSETASLEVEQITDTGGDKIGIFVGDSSGGDFRNVFVKYAK